MDVGSSLALTKIFMLVSASWLFSKILQQTRFSKNSKGPPSTVFSIVRFFTLHPIFFQERRSFYAIFFFYFVFIEVHTRFLQNETFCGNRGLLRVFGIMQLGIGNSKDHCWEATKFSKRKYQHIFTSISLKLNRKTVIGLPSKNLLNFMFWIFALDNLY